MAESRLAVYGAIAANLAIATTKFIVAGVTGSSAMLSEGIHSTVDTGNGVLLLVGLHLSQRPPSVEHPFGHGKELYFWSLIVAVLVAIATFGVVGWLIGDRMAGQIEALRQRLPQALDALTAWLNGHAIGLAILDLWRDAKGGDLPWARVANAATLSLKALASAFLMLVLGIYLAANPPLYRRGLLRLLPPSWRTPVDDALVASGHALARWLMGQAVSMSFVGTTTAVGLALLGMPMALSLGIIAALLGFIPFFGAISSGVLAVVFALVLGPTLGLFVAALVIAIKNL
jgi:predicted PurR-regulated permease PerM